MNEVLEVIRTRRGVKEYLDKPVPKELIDQIVEAGLWAASGRNKQPQTFLVFTNKEEIDRLREANHSFQRAEGDPSTERRRSSPFSVKKIRYPRTATAHWRSET